MSELYQLPDGWEWKTINDVCIKVTDGSHKSPKTIDVGKPYITVKDINSDGIIDFNECKFISDEDFDLLVKNNCKPNNGDILFSKDGTVGKVALVNYDIDFVVLSSLAILKPSKNILPEYLKNYLLSPYFYDNAIKSKTGAAIKRVVLKTIKELNVPLSTLSKQQRIVTKLNTLFEKIDKAITLHVKNVKEADGFMVSVLNEVFSDLEEKYGKVTLNSMANFQNGFAFKSNEFNSNGDGLQVIRIGNVLDLNKNQVYIDERREFEKYLLKANDIVISMTGTRGKMDYLFVRVVNEESCYLNQRVGKISNKNNAHFKYLYYFLQSNIFRDQIFQYETGTVNQGNISSKDIMNQNIPNSPLPIQQKVVTHLDDLSFKIERVKKVQKEKMESLKALKASILDSAFRGEL